MDEAHTNEITSRFYNNMIDESGRLDHGRAALALDEGEFGRIRTFYSLRLESFLALSWMSSNSVCCR